jgi:hypothetical protein
VFFEKNIQFQKRLGMSGTHTKRSQRPARAGRAAGHVAALFCIAASSGCGDNLAPVDPVESVDAAPVPDSGAVSTLYSLGSIIEDADGERTTYVQTITSLDIDQATNAEAIELPGNGIHLAHGGHVFLGLDEAPTMIRYTPDASGTLQENGRLSFTTLGVTSVGFGNAFVSDRKAYMVSEQQYVAAVWDPEAMELITSIDLSYLEKDGFDVEFWTVTYYQGRVYIPVRYTNWGDRIVDQSVTLVIIDAEADTILATATDSRCYSGGRPVFAPNGDAYVMSDGRNWSAQLFATMNGDPVPANCLLRIRAGALEFDPDFLVEIPSLTGGLEVATELETGLDGSGVAFAKMFYPDEVPAEVPLDDNFEFWQEPAFKMWRIELGDTPSAMPVEDIPFSALAWEGASVDGKLYTGESPDYTSSLIFEIDPAANRAVPLFEMEGTFYGLRKLR